MKPKKFHRCGPFLPVKNLRETLDFYREKFGFYEEWTWGKLDGGIRRDDMRLVFCEDSEYIAQLNNETYHFTLLWFVDNVDEIYIEFKSNKIAIARDIVNEPYGIREFGVFDNNGYFIRVSEGITNQE
ncbi:MAG TPA: VOC family protein [Chitinophagaceae bacterium]|nr:VOC family protein [Chitinophagaceae bacterium]